MSTGIFPNLLSWLMGRISSFHPKGQVQQTELLGRWDKFRIVFFLLKIDISSHFNSISILPKRHWIFAVAQPPKWLVRCIRFLSNLEEHIDLGIKYDPGTGIYGMDFYVHLSRPGSRVKNRKLKVGKVGAAHKLRKDRQYLDLPNMCLFFAFLVGFFGNCAYKSAYLYKTAQPGGKDDKGDEM